MKEIRINFTDKGNTRDEMAISKLDDMSLIVFYKQCHQGAWSAAHKDYLPIYDDREYFLCLPKHKKECLHWLNGGEIQIKIDKYGWLNLDDDQRWSANSGFMQEDYEFRIKPKKVKKMIAVDKNTWRINREYPTNQDCVSRDLFDAENIEFIEVEVYD